MSLVRLNPKPAANAGREMQLSIAGLTDRKIFFTVLGDDADVIQAFCDEANSRHFEDNGIVERNATQKKEFMEAKFALQVTAVRTVMNDKKNTEKPKIEIGEGEWLPAGPELAKRIFAEDLRFVYEPVFGFARTRSNFLPETAKG